MDPTADIQNTGGRPCREADACTDFDILQYLPEKAGEEEMPVSTKGAMKQIKAYIAAKGFCYPEELIENFFLSLKSKPLCNPCGGLRHGKDPAGSAVCPGHWGGMQAGSGSPGLE